MTDYLTKLTSLLIAPHGITDIIYSYETDTIYTMIGIYIVCPIISKQLNHQFYTYLSILSSFIHFRHDIYPMIPSMIMISYYLNYNEYYESYRAMIYYLSFIHVPFHYYTIFIFTNYIYQQLFIISLYTLLSYKINIFLIEWIHIHLGTDKLSKFIGGIIMSHIFFNEYVYLIT